MRALILAAGEGTRLRPLTNKIPKTMVPLNGRPLLYRQLDMLHACGISDIGIVGGYCADALPADRATLYINPDFSSTNMVYSMFQAEDVFRADQDVLIVYGDILFGRDSIHDMINTPGDVVVGVNTQWRKLWEARFEDPLSDLESMILDGNTILELGQPAATMDEIQGQFTGLIKFSGKTVAEIWNQWGRDTLKNPVNSSVSKLYMTDFLQGLIDGGSTVTAAFIKGDWLEIDSVEDLELYEKRIQTETLSSIVSLEVDASIKTP